MHLKPSLECIYNAVLVQLQIKWCCLKNQRRLLVLTSYKGFWVCETNSVTETTSEIDTRLLSAIPWPYMHLYTTHTHTHVHNTHAVLILIRVHTLYHMYTILTCTQILEWDGTSQLYLNKFETPQSSFGEFTPIT